MKRRLLSRNQGRVDDNIDTIRECFKVFVESSLSVIENCNSKGMVKKIDAGKPVEVFEAFKAVFAPVDDKDCIRSNCILGLSCRLAANCLYSLAESTGLTT